jgi:tetratricopeptide (TPR) repeat protein
MVANADPQSAGALLLEEAAAARSTAAAAPSRAAADWLAGDPNAAASALSRAIEADPQSTPAVWALEALARRHAGDPAYPAAEWGRQAARAILDVADDALLRAEAALRLANNTTPTADADADAEERAQLEAQAIEHLCRALEECPRDPTLVDLVASAAPAAAKQRLDQLAEASAQDAPDIARLQRVRVAWLYATTGEHAEAAARYRAALAANPEDGLARAFIDRAELLAGEHARVGERRFAALRSAEDANDVEAKAAALASMAALDLYERSDASAAILTLRALDEASPAHVPTLRALERLYMDQGRRPEVADVATKLLRAVESPSDIATYLPFASRLLVREADDGAAGDALYLEHAGKSEKTLRVARRWLAVAEARQEREQATAALRTLGELTENAMEKATHSLRAATHRSAEGGAQAAAAELGRDDAVLQHPVAAALLGHYRATAGYALPAAEAFVEAAKLASDETYAGAFWYEAGCLFQDKHEDERALAAFERTVAIDITHRSVFGRMRELLEARDAHERLAALISQRLARGGDTETIAGLHVAQAALAERMGDNVAAREALRAALALHPDSRESLERLARICLNDEIWPEAEGTLIRWARLERNEANLRFVFFSLGDIYDRHIRQDARAEAAFQRVLKLAPADLVTLDRLALLYQRTGKVNEAVAALQRMVEVEQSVNLKRDLRLRIGSTLEVMGHPREAEQAFEHVRRSASTDLVVVRALASFFERQDARPALAMHLNRAVGDYRRAIEIDPAETANWVALVDVMVMRGRRDGARCAASAALALGIPEPQAGQAVDTRGGVPGAGHAAADPAMKDFLAKDDLSHAALVVFEKAEEALEKVLPLDIKALNLDKVLPKEHPVRAEASDVGKWFGFSDVHPRVTHSLPRVCVPISMNPLTLVVGAELIEHTDPRERRFLFARACEIAKAGLSVTLRSPPAQLALALAGLVHAYDPNYLPEGVDPAQLEDIGQRVVKALPRRAREEMGPLAVEMAGRPGFDPRTIGLAAGDLGSRVALLATGDLIAALSALLKLNSRVLEGDTRHRAELLRAVPETASLLRFAVSEEYLDARQRAGADSL